MASERRQLALLGAIVAIFIAVVWWQVTRDDGTSQTAAAKPAAPGGGAVAPPLVARPVPALALAALKQDGAEPVDTGRDPFRFDAARSGGPGGPGRPGISGLPPPAGHTTVPAGPVEPSGPPPPPPILLKYIGRAKQGATGRLLAVLRDDRGVYYGAEGDVIEGRYRLLRVSNDSVDVAYVDGRGRKTIPLSGGQP